MIFIKNQIKFNLKPIISFFIFQLVVCWSLNAQFICNIGDRKVEHSESIHVEYSGLAYSIIDEVFLIPIDKPVGGYHIKGYDLKTDQSFNVRINGLIDNDLEGLTYLENNYFALIEEDQNRLYFYKYNHTNKQLSLKNSVSTNIALATNGDGLEGITYDPHTNRLFFVREHFERELFSIEVVLPTDNIDGSLLRNTLSSVILPDSHFDDPNFSIQTGSCQASDLDASGLHHLGQNFKVNSPFANHMLVLSDGNRKILEYEVSFNTSGKIILNFIEEQFISNESQPEGITVVDDKIYIASEKRCTETKVSLSSYSIKENAACTCQYTDPIALKAIYNSLYTSPYPLWDLSKPMNTWHGVTLNANGCVDKLKLDEKKMEGTIPAEIGDLKQITSIDFGENYIQGSIPKEIGNLVTLTALNLGVNQLVDPVPTTLGNLINLDVLNLGGTRLTQLPASIGELTKLQRLYLQWGQFTSVPTSIANLSELQILDLGNNNLTEISGAINSLKNLTTLRLNNNQISGELPVWLSDLDQLTELRIQNNQLSGCYVDELKQLCQQLNSMVRPNRYISEENNFTTDWEDFCNTNNGNCNTATTQGFIGEVRQSSICRQKDSLALVSIYESLNGQNLENHRKWDFTKPMDTWFGVTLNANGCVDKLEIYEKNLSGQIPTAIGDLSEITVIELSENDITGYIPWQVGNLKNLKKFSVALNKMDGDVPAKIGNLTNLENLQLHGNQFTNVPAAIGNLTNLKRLYLHDNQLKHIPAAIGDLKNLEVLHINDNQLVNIPVAMSKLTNLTELQLSNNQLINIPSAMGALSNLTRLHIDNNELPYIPKSIGNLSKLTHLYANNNQFIHVPAAIGDLSNLKVLHLNNNVMEALPASISSLDNLQTFHVNENMIAGQLPVWLTEMDNLSDLKIQNNQLSGCFANNLTDLCNQLPSFRSKNDFISDGNFFDLSWEAFCSGSTCNGNKISKGENIETYNYPNPFTDHTSIYYILKKDATVSLNIYDATGKQITSLLKNETLKPGHHHTVFQVKDMPGGVYYYHLQSNEFNVMKKIVFIP